MKYLRKRLRDGDDDKICSQAVLAAKAGMSEGTLKKIESGTHPDPTPYVESLANVLQLTEFQKHHFFAVAGLIYPLKHHIVTQNDVVDILSKLDCPAYARTALWDFIAFNDYHRLLWGYTDETLALLRAGDLGPNLLRVQFEKEFQDTLAVRRVDDRPKRAIKVFRGEAFQYVTTNRYQQIVKYFKNNQKFQNAWRLSEYEDDDELVMSLDRAFVDIVHPDYGTLSFFSAKVPDRYIGTGITIALYHPIATQSDAWARFSQDVRKNFVHRFLDITDSYVDQVNAL